MEKPTIKQIVWVGSSLEDLRKFPAKVKDDIGYALYEAQQGKMPANSKLMKGFSGVIEIRTDHIKDTYRTVYAVKLGDQLYVLHVFKKKSKTGIKTPKPDIHLIEERLKIAQSLVKEKK